MRVLQICAAYKPAFIYGGPTMSVSVLSEQLAKAGIDTAVFTTTANGKTELPITPAVPVNLDGVTVTYFKRLTKDHTHFSPALLKQLRREAGKFDIIHIHAWWNLVSVGAALVALGRKTPVLISARGTLSPYSFSNKNTGIKRAIHNLLGKRLLNRCHFHATSEQEREAVSRLLHPKSITVLPNFVKLPARTKMRNRERGPVFKLIFLSRIEEKKGLDILISALKDISVPFRLTIAGDGEQAYVDQLKKMAATQGIDDKIDWIGFQAENKFSLLYEHDLFVLPSYDENFGNAVIESLSVGTPVLIGAGVGLADYVSYNRLGWICETTPASVSAMINEIAREQAAECQKIREQAPAIIYRDFDETDLVKRYIDMYRQITTNERL